MCEIANDYDYIKTSLNEILKVDDFTSNLFKVYESILKEGLAQKNIACINRSDYMIDSYLEDNKSSFRIRQVEINAIASSMSAHSQNTQLMHNYLMTKYRVPIDKSKGATIPKNDALNMVAQGLIDAYDKYGVLDSYILLVSEERSSNFSDFLYIELTVSKMRPDIRIVRIRFCDLHDVAQLGPNKELFIDKNKEIALVYFRYGYDPSNYNFGAAWSVRILLERSKAIKCPSINFHLSGAKKFQQLLNSSLDLEKFLSASDAKKLSQVFCKFWSIEASSPEGEKGFQIGLSNAKNLVLKPQREGGGHNIFGNDIAPFLNQQVSQEERSQYILMELINSPKEKNWLLLHDDNVSDDKSRLYNYDELVSELGIYGSVLSDGRLIERNRAAGYLVRSKKFGTNEGGVATGYAGISSLVLLDQSRDTDFSLYFTD